ncbi:MAG: hypothetical protein N2C14_31435, partial [Planctomycetales bacterium]
MNAQTEIHLAPERDPVFTVRVTPLGASIHPVQFPYRLEDVHGTAVCQDGMVALEGFRGRRGRVKVALQGQCDFDAEGRWKLRLFDLSAERLRFNRERDPELFQALPSEMKSAVESLQPTGPVNLQGSLQFAGDADPESPVQANWNLTLQLQGVNVGSDVALRNMHGEISVQGVSDGKATRAQCELDLDSAYFQGHQLTEIKGPIHLDGSQVTAGSPYALQNRFDWRRLPQGERHLSAKFFGGEVILDGRIQRGTPLTYHLRAALANGDVGRYAREKTPGRQNHLNGKAFANIDLRGTGLGISSMQGYGSAALREADVYEAPLMVSMLSILRLKPPGSTAFAQGDLKFRIRGRWIEFEQFDFRGDAVSLLLHPDKKGTFDHATGELNLQFYAMVGAARRKIPILGQVVGETSQQLLRIHVNGTLANPVVRRQAAPAVSGAMKGILQQLQRNLTNE